MIAIRRFGSGDPIVALHGFTLTGAQFSSLDLDRIQIVAPDLPGHGDTEAAGTDPDEVLRDIAAVIRCEAPHTPVLGYSQGARLALSMTAQGLVHPSALIVISGTPGILDDADRAQRAAKDRETAGTITKHGIETFIDSWVDGGLTSTSHLDPEVRTRDRQIRLTNTAEGLASALQGYGQGAMTPVWHLLDRIQMPTLVVTGADDARYTAIGVQMAEAIGPNAEFIAVNAAGHNPLMDQPTATAAIVAGFLRQTTSSGSETAGSIGTGEPEDQS